MVKFINKKGLQFTILSALKILQTQLTSNRHPLKRKKVCVNYNQALQQILCTKYREHTK